MDPRIKSHSTLNEAACAAMRALKTPDLTRAEHETLQRIVNDLLELQGDYDRRTGAFELWWAYYMPGHPIPAHAKQREAVDVAYR